jgi:hypothetical protein
MVVRNEDPGNTLAGARRMRDSQPASVQDIGKAVVDNGSQLGLSYVGKYWAKEVCSLA